MPRRKRDHIPIIEKLASALADFLPQQQRDELRAARVPARQVVRLFTPDHVVLHTHDGADKWWNLTMKLRGPVLKAKDNRDTSIAAKVIRVAGTQEEFRRRLLAPTKKRVTRDSRWPRGRKLQSKGFGKRGRRT